MLPLLIHYVIVRRYRAAFIDIDYGCRYALLLRFHIIIEATADTLSPPFTLMPRHFHYASFRQIFSPLSLT